MESMTNQDRNNSSAPMLYQPPLGKKHSGGLRVGQIDTESFLTCELCDVRISGTKLKLCKSCGFVCLSIRCM